MSQPIVVRRPRALLRATGRDPVRMVHGLATNDIEAVSDTAGVYTTFLTPKGRIIADARVFRFPGDEGLLIDLDPDALPSLREHLAKSVPPLFARFEDVSGDWAVVGVHGHGAGRAAARAASANPADLAEAAPDHTAVPLPPDGGGIAVRTRLAGDEGWDLFVPAGRAGALEAALVEAGASPGSPEELDRRRVLAGVPAWGAELTGDVIPLEAGLLRPAISQTKGCYTGQEVIVRILHRGHVNRHLRRIRTGPGVKPPSPGTELYQEGGDRSRGVVTSMVASEDGGVGLGYVRREIEPPAELRAGSGDGPPVRIEALDRAARAAG